MPKSLEAAQGELRAAFREAGFEVIEVRVVRDNAEVSINKAKWPAWREVKALCEARGWTFKDVRHVGVNYVDINVQLNDWTAFEKLFASLRDFPEEELKF